MKKICVFIIIFVTFIVTIVLNNTIVNAMSETKTNIYPYFGKDGAYINIIVITNATDIAGSADITLYEQDGDVFTATIAIAAHRIYLSMLRYIDWVSTNPSAVMGDSRGHVLVSSNLTLNGLAMITNPSTGESISYIPSREEDINESVD